MNRSRTAAKAVQQLSRYTGRNETEVDTIARELIDAGDLPKSKGRDFAQLNVREFGLLTLATLCVDRPTRTVQAMEQFKKLRILSPDKAKPEDINKATDALSSRGLSLLADPLPNIATVLALFQVDYFQRPETAFYKRVDKATVIIDRAQPSAILDWGDGDKDAKHDLYRQATASVFGKITNLKSIDYGVMPLEARWPMKFFLLAQLNFFTMTAGWVGEEKQA